MSFSSELMKDNTSKQSDKNRKNGQNPPKKTTGGIVKNYTIKKSSPPSIESLYRGILKGDISMLGQAITLVESNHRDHKSKASEIVTKCLRNKTSSVRIGITGVPGVGKSTFIEAFGIYLTELGNKVAVLAVDPSSSIHKGSILADKTRMELLANNPHAYIRPTAAGASLGGVANNTREAITLCEAAGYNIVLVETVGVGQSETAVHAMVDFFLLLKLPGAGDELQGIKRGVTEMADALVINKADNELLAKAKLAKTTFNRALQLYPPKKSGWKPKVLLCSAVENTGIRDIWKMIKDFVALTQKNGYFYQNRKAQSTYWVKETIEKQLTAQFYQHPVIKKEWPNLLAQLADQKITSYEAAEKILALYMKNEEKR